MEYICCGSVAWTLSGDDKNVRVAVWHKYATGHQIVPSNQTIDGTLLEISIFV